MKNRMYNREPNGKLFCLHDWQPNGWVPSNWDISYMAKVPAKCKKCGKEKWIRSINFESWPDELVKKVIRYE